MRRGALGSGVSSKMLLDLVSYALPCLSDTSLVGWEGGLSTTKTNLGLQLKLKLILAIILT